MISNKNVNRGTRAVLGGLFVAIVSASFVGCASPGPRASSDEKAVANAARAERIYDGRLEPNSQPRVE